MYRPLATLMLVVILSACEHGSELPPVTPEVAESVSIGQTLIFGTYEVTIDGRSMLPYRPAKAFTCGFSHPIGFIDYLDVSERADTKCKLMPQTVILLNLMTEDIVLQETDEHGHFYFLVPEGVYALIGMGNDPRRYLYDPAFNVEGFVFSTVDLRFAYVGTRKLSFGSAERPFDFDEYLRQEITNVSVENLQDRAVGDSILVERYPNLAPSEYGVPQVHLVMHIMAGNYVSAWTGLSDFLPVYLEAMQSEARLMGLLPSS